jgi:endonuclease/exonuclease/phosphatase family metal-dependent hydrolase
MIRHTIRQFDRTIISLVCRIITALVISNLYSLNGETFRIATYNVLNFPDAMGIQRTNYLRTVIEYIKPDVLVVQEMQSQDGVDLFLDSVMNYQADTYRSTTFHDGPGTDNAIFYNQNAVQLLHEQYLSTVNRDIAQYRLRFSESQHEFHLFSAHFKSSQGSDNELIRLQEATALREHLSYFAQGSYFMVTGDFNIYYSDESAFQYLTGDFSNNNGRLYDPLNASGVWHENSGFTEIHTQSTRFEQLADGGAGGGLDDRFDMILCSFDFLDSAGLFMTDHSYNILGNDGNHFDLSINDGYNSVVPVDVADALYYASDHLPLFVDINDGNLPAIPERTLKIWPNPMRNIACVEFPWVDDFEDARITITNIVGQRIYENTTSDPSGFVLRRGSLPVGVYFVYVQVRTRYSTIDYRSKMAVIE